MSNGPVILQFSAVSDFAWVYDDKGSGASMDGAFYRPLPPTGWFVLGDYGQGNYQPPNGTVLVVQVVQDSSVTMQS